MAKIIGLDLGTTTLGVAITDQTQRIVTGRPTIHFKAGNYHLALQQLVIIIEEVKPKTIVFGKPLHMDGRAGERVKSVERFANDLQKVAPQVKINFVDERLSTVEAHERMEMLAIPKKKWSERVDEFAAIIILENYLNRLKEHGNEQD
ncbi:MAG: Holliday junction resolvase RuvX [Bacilli bacterium]